MEVLDLFRGLDQMSAAVEDKWLALLIGRKSAEGWREKWRSSEGGRRVNHIRGLVTVINGGNDC